MRYFLLAVMLCTLGACDRASDQTGQEIAGIDKNVGDFKDGDTFESESGLVGKLDISQRGESVVDTPFQNAAGQTVRLSDFAGKPILVNIWATWCAPCVVEMPMLDKLAAREEERLQVLVVSQDIQGPEKVDPFFDKAKFAKLEAYTDPDNGLSFGFGSGLMPTTVLYDSGGKEVWRVVGAMDWDGPRAAMLLEETLSEG